MGAQSSSSPPAGSGPPVAEAVAAREEGLSLVARVNRWMIGLAVLLAGALTGLTAHGFHPKTASAHTATSAPNTPATSAPNPPATSGTGTGDTSAPLQPPASAPAPAAPAPAPVAPAVSGGS